MRTPHWQTTKRGMPRRQLSSPKTCLILAKTSSAPLCVWCGTLEDFPTAGPDSLLLFINEYSHLVGLHLFFFLPLKLFSSPLIFVWSFCNVYLWYVSFHTPAAESYAKFHLFLMPSLFVILYAKLGVQNVPYFESSENNTHLSICICSVIISGHVSSVLVKLVIQQQHKPNVQTADQAVKTIPAAQLWSCVRELWLCTPVQHTGTKPLLSVSGSEKNYLCFFFGNAKIICFKKSLSP